MPQFKRSNTVELEITSKCTLACPHCPRTRQAKDKDYWDNGNIDTDTVIQAIDDKIKNIIVCGAYGDAIYHPEVDKILKSLNDKNIPYSFDTNGSYVKDEVWERVADHISYKDTFIFSIDGPPDNFTTYRVNGHWPSIERGIRILTNRNKRLRWKYIVFKYNSSYEDIKGAYDKAWELGVTFFSLVHTKRTEEGQYVELSEFSATLDTMEDYVNGLKKEDYPEGTNKPPKLRIDIHPRIRKVNEAKANLATFNVSKTTISDDRRKIERKSTRTMVASGGYRNIAVPQNEYYTTEKVYPQCINVTNWPQFIGSDGIFYPCCYTRAEKKSIVGGAGLTEDDLASMSVYNHTIDEIIAGPGYQKIMDNFDNISVCKSKCPAKS